jgi:CHRD domain/PEP-CTERM motif
MMRTALLTLITALSLAVAPAANAAIINFEVELLGSNEDPPNASPGEGTGHIVIDTDAMTMKIDVEFMGLLGTTTAAHIHCCTVAGNIGVATQLPSFIGFPSGVTSGAYFEVFDLLDLATYNPAFVTANGGTAQGAFDFLFAGMLAGESYFNIHTMMFSGGEIRGTLIQVPEPASLGLLALALAGLAAAPRRSKPR